jgi:hypothetical protein
MKPAFPFLILLAACGSTASSLGTTAPLAPIDSVAPPDILTSVLLAYSRRTRLLIVDDHTSSCMDMSLPQWHSTFDTLSIAARVAAQDCTRRSATRLRIPISALRAPVPVVSQSSRRAKPSIETPVLFLSRAGVSSDGSIAAIEVSMYCGGSVCSATALYWFRKTESGWEFQTRWTLFVS